MIGYAIKRLLSRGFLDRHGLYACARQPRAMSLCAMGNSDGVYHPNLCLVSEFGGEPTGRVSRYSPTGFAAVAVVGRLIWTSAYLGLGYFIGGDLQAATIAAQIGMIPAKKETPPRENSVQNFLLN
jgi:hypothetical protein